MQGPVALLAKRVSRCTVFQTTIAASNKFSDDSSLQVTLNLFGAPRLK
jgi:hypothetical protein